MALCLHKACSYTREQQELNMSILSPFLIVEQNCEEVLRSVRETLTEAGFRAAQTFDLQIARQAHLECKCPNHGTTNCNCQMIILLVYGKQEDPATLILHSEEGTTGISLAGPASDHAAQNLGGIIRRTLMSKISYVSVQPKEVSHVRASL